MKENVSGCFFLNTVYVLLVTDRRTDDVIAHSSLPSTWGGS